MLDSASLAAELRELNEMMEKRNEKLCKTLATLKDCINGMPLRDPRSVQSLETYLHLIDLTFMEVNREQRKFRDWVERASQNRRGISEETLGRLREYRRKMGADSDEEIIEELLRIVEIRAE
jgi:hypothetical protein